MEETEIGHRCLYLFRNLAPSLLMQTLKFSEKKLFFCVFFLSLKVQAAT